MFKFLLIQGLLLYWLPLGSSSDFCLNVASEFNCPLSSCRLLEARGQLERAFQLLFQEMEKNKQDEQRMCMFFQVYIKIAF